MAIQRAAAKPARIEVIQYDGTNYSELVAAVGERSSYDAQERGIFQDSDGVITFRPAPYPAAFFVNTTDWVLVSEPVAGTGAAPVSSDADFNAGWWLW